VKPDLARVMKALAIWMRRAIKWKVNLFVWVEDAAFYFNQFAYAPEEYWKSTLVVGARRGDVSSDGREFDPGGIVQVSEKRLGFGSFASSNIAQRFSNALVGWTMSEFDALEQRSRVAHPQPEWEQWITERKPLEDECRRQRPKQKGQALSDCTQTRLGGLYVFTVRISLRKQMASDPLLLWGKEQWMSLSRM
jgi:hypothetical protein